MAQVSVDEFFPVSKTTKYSNWILQFCRRFLSVLDLHSLSYTQGEFSWVLTVRYSWYIPGIAWLRVIVILIPVSHRNFKNFHPLAH